MARSTMDDLAYGERWDKDRFMFERDRERERDRFEERDRYTVRGPPGRPREISVDDRYERRAYSRPPWEEDHARREKRYVDDDYPPRRSPPPEFSRRIVIDSERERGYHNPSPPPRPTLLRRQSSLDTFDRKPKFYEREEYGPPARRGDYRPDPYQPIPLPRSRALPPPRIYAERDYDDIHIAEPDRYGNEEYHPYPQLIREREISRSRKRRERSGSRTSRAKTHHSSSARSSSRTSTTSSSSSSSSGGTTVTVKSTAKSEYPKKGKTRIPSKLVSKRALIDLGYPFIEEDKVIVVQKALGQENIDDLLKLSEDYKKAEVEVAAARSQPGHVIEERKEEVFTIPPPPVPVPATTAPPPAPAAPVTEVVKETTVVRAPSPSLTSRSSRSSRSYSTSTTARTPLVVEANPREFSHDVPLGPLALVGDRRRSDREIKMEIERLEVERDLMRRDRHRHHHHRHRSHSHSHSPGAELIQAERLSTGELVVYQEMVEKVEEPRRGVRIEKDKKGPPPGLMKAMLATLT